MTKGYFVNFEIQCSMTEAVVTAANQSGGPALDLNQGFMDLQSMA